MRIDHLGEDDRLVPRPPSLRSDDEALFAELQRVATDAFLCTYLGQSQGSKYEPDPSKWTSGRTRATVWYEWNHVYRGADREPHRVCTSVHDILHHERAAPHYPLKATLRATCTSLSITCRRLRT